MTSEDATTQLVTTPGATPDRPLTEDEILSGYLPAMWAAFAAFATDVRYAAEMAEQARMIEFKQAIYTERAEIIRSSPSLSSDEVGRLARSRLAELGVHPPPARGR